MNQYTTYCTPEQTRKAIELGAPIKECGYYYKQKIGCETISDTDLHILPTAEQMIGWLREQNLFIEVMMNDIDGNRHFDGLVFINTTDEVCCTLPKETYKEATLAAIDAALEYLEINKE